MAVRQRKLDLGLDEYIKDQIDSLLDGVKERVDSVETNVLEDEMSKVSSSSKAAATLRLVDAKLDLANKGKRRFGVRGLEVAKRTS